VVRATGWGLQIPEERDSPRTKLYGGPSSSDPRHLDDTSVDDRFDLGDDEEEAEELVLPRPGQKPSQHSNGRSNQQVPLKSGDPNKPSAAATVDIPLD
jgi:hypothetical protein